MAFKAFHIIHQDDDLIICNKRAGISTVPGRNLTHPSLKEYLQQKYDPVLTVHRIDKDTSGLVCFALNPTTHKALNEMFRQREVKKIYKAIVTGRLEKEKGVIKNYLQEGSNGKMLIRTKGKLAISEYEVEEIFDQCTVVNVNILTGRMHQIRVHMKSIGHPLYVDPIYGHQSSVMLSSIKKKGLKLSKGTIEKPLLNRLSLHAHRLEFEHPTTKERIIAEAPIPKDLRAIINQLKKNN